MLTFLGLGMAASTHADSSLGRSQGAERHSWGSEQLRGSPGQQPAQPAQMKLEKVTAPEGEAQASAVPCTNNQNAAPYTGHSKHDCLV